jgi:hypothetical protein
MSTLRDSLNDLFEYEWITFTDSDGNSESMSSEELGYYSECLPEYRTLSDTDMEEYEMDDDSVDWFRRLCDLPVLYMETEEDDETSIDVRLGGIGYITYSDFRRLD